MPENYVDISEPNPFQVEIDDVTIEKFDGSDRLSILPQFVEISIYQSIFTPFIRAELLIYDPIGLIVNYPLTGEEIIRIRYNQTSSGRIVKNGFQNSKFPFGNPFQASLNSTSTITSRQLSFCVNKISETVPTDQARSQMYILNLSSLEFYENTRTKISEYFDSPYDEDAKFLWDTYLTNPTRRKETARGVRYFKRFWKDSDLEGNSDLGKPRKETQGLVVPNVPPTDAINLMMKYTIPETNPEKYSYNVFFENSYGFFYTTIQSLIEDQKAFKNEMKEREKYIYTSNYETKKRLVQENQAYRLISNLVFNSRFSSVDKITGGYFRSELYEINPQQRKYWSTVSDLSESDNDGYLYNHRFNTDAYINEISEGVFPDVGEEDSPHIKYEVVLHENTDYSDRREKYNSAIKYLHALKQIDIHITIPGDLSHNCGELIYCEVPEFHGFERIQEDRYISGLFLVGEVKHSIGAGKGCSTSLRLYKDSLREELATTMNYELENQ